MLKVSKIILYEEPTVTEIQLKKIKEFIENTFQIEIEIRRNFFKFSNEEIFQKITNTKIFDLKIKNKKYVPTIDDIQIEKESKDTFEKEDRILYDGFELQRVITEFIPINENTEEILHIIFTNKLTCTFDDTDFRYHARALIAANPTIISTTGIVEAPAKPKQYYLDLMVGLSKEETNEKFKGEFLEYHDSRLHEIAEGYLLQSIIYYETGEAFCENKECRLFNAHWQKDLFYSQIKNKNFCEEHFEIINKLKNKQ